MPLRAERVPNLRFFDLCPERESFRDEVRKGLRLSQKRISPSFLYDQRGSRLFDRICELDEYYPTRTEISILTENREEIAEFAGPESFLIEYGAGGLRKASILLDRLRSPSAYMPIDISREQLLDSAYAAARRYPELPILPVCADFTRPIEIPFPDSRNRLGFFPGSTIGNFERRDATRFLGTIARQIQAGLGLLIGVDLVKDERTLEAAYNDRAGVTARFNLNLLSRINSELGGGFRLDRFRHVAFYNRAKSRIEMHLQSLIAQTVRVDGLEIPFATGETIHTENSYKYTVESFVELAMEAGLTPARFWTDPACLFGLFYLTA